MNALSKYKNINKGMRCLEIGVGTGWFIVLVVKQYGLICDGLEISPQILEFAKKNIYEEGIEPNLFLGNIENPPLVSRKYDIIVASSVFEHVEKYKNGIENIYKLLKPGGSFYFASTNKFSLTYKSGEFWLPFYDKLPDKVRYKIRIWADGEDIMKLGIDFNTFTNKELINIFKQVGFSKVYDHIDLKYINDIKSPFRKIIFKHAK